MRKRFKARRRKKYALKFILIVVVLILIYIFSNILLKSFKLDITNKDYIKLLINDSNHHILKSSDNLVEKLGYKLLKHEIVSPLNMLENTYNYNISSASDFTFKEENDEYIKDPNPVKMDNPRVYIYNTHQLEGYDKVKKEQHNVKPNVMMASYMLREKLNKKDVNTIVETGDITTLLNSNGWDYSNSYKASRYFVEDTLKKYPSLDLIIDLHRDAISKKSSTVTINNKNYAKVLFVVGLEHKNYKSNLELANKLNNLIKEKYPSLTRGVLKKQGKYVNGIYNQDLSKNVILIECGGYKNTIDEVNNTLDIISEIIKVYLEEK